MNGIKTICEILRNPEYPQTIGALVVFESNGKIKSKCALGEISCRVGLELKTKDDIPLISEYWHILDRAGVPFWLTTHHQLPNFNYLDGQFDFEENSNLQDIIFSMNDTHFTYNQIADFLETTFPEDLD